MADSSKHPNPQPVSPNWKIAQVGWGIGFLVLIAFTWPLWWPKGQYPVVPLLGFLGKSLSTESLEIACRAQTGVMLVGLLILAAFILFRRDASQSKRYQGLLFLFAATLAAGGLLDNHRLQPWYYQTMLYALAGTTLSPKRWIAWVTGSIYIFSALGKIDHEFANLIGKQMIDVIADPIERHSGIQAGDESLMKFARLLPVPEFVAGLCWLFRTTRRTGAFLSAGMHLVLIVLLGPWMLNHSWGVIGWNALLFAQSAYVLRWGLDDLSEASREATWRLASGFSNLVLGTALIMPMVERAGFWDHWLSWALYSPHVSRVTVEVHRRDLADVGFGFEEYVDESEGQWKRLSLGGWALGERFCPVYPQARYQLKLVLASTVNVDPRGVRVVVWSVADRRSGERKQTLLGNRDQIASHLRKTSWLD
ncbi:MAG: hypothetical protein AAF664_05155 [Planctomycetota bacterium]